MNRAFRDMRLAAVAAVAGAFGLLAPSRSRPDQPITQDLLTKVTS